MRIAEWFSFKVSKKNVQANWVYPCTNNEYIITDKRSTLYVAQALTYLHTLISRAINVGIKLEQLRTMFAIQKPYARVAEYDSAELCVNHDKKTQNDSKHYSSIILFILLRNRTRVHKK